MPKKNIVRQLFSALKKNKTKQINELSSRLKDHKINLEQKNDSGETLLIAAAKNGSVECINALLSEKAFVDAQDSFGRTALMLASTKSPDNVHPLLEAKASLDMQANTGITALHEAVLFQKADIVCQLLDAKASVNIEGYAGLNLTALDLAMDHCNIPAINLLLNNNAIIRNPSRLYDLLASLGAEMDTLPAFIALYERECDLQTLDDGKFNELTKIYDYHKLHNKNIKGLIDKATGEKIPDVLLNIISEYNTPHENLLNKLDQSFSFFNPKHFNKALKIEKSIDTSLHQETKSKVLNRYHFRESTIAKRHCDSNIEHTTSIKRIKLG